MYVALALLFYAQLRKFIAKTFWKFFQSNSWDLRETKQANET